jgi:tRNA-specific 2-thiouridylase
MKKVYVGLSGGVDSGTSAALLKERGYDVTGVFIKIWQPEFIECTWREDRLDALRICAALDIPFCEIDLSDEYKKDVVDAMVADYEKGITPNPDVLCNEKIKFGAFMRWAIAQGADAVATGHYAQIGERGSQTILLRGLDAAKDQSYFLHRLSSDQLSRVMFPIGGMHKSDVRDAARRFGLPVAEKPDSQGLCFVGDVSMRDFLRRYISLESGPIFDMNGAIVGEHEGAALYTIGQRHGFTIANTSTGGAHYVVAIDTEKNTLTVSSDRDDASRKTVRLRDTHWIGATPAFPIRVSVQTRYHETPVPAEISQEGSDTSCTFDTPHIASPGQSLVIYLPAQAGDADICLGGGIICA